MKLIRISLTVLGVALLILVSTDIAADGQIDSTAKLPSGRSIEEFITSDGHFDMKAVHRSGYQGAMDLDGFEMAIDPATGRPTFSPMTAEMTAGSSDNIYWDNDLSPALQGLYGIGNCSIVFDGKLIIGGEFQIAGDIFVNSIAAWDGTSWSTLGSGVNGTVYALANYDNQLIAAGFFNAAGGTPANDIAAWDGYEWSALGFGLNSRVTGLAVYNNQLVAVGDFTEAGGVAAKNIAAWDGSSWSPIGSGNDLPSSFELDVIVYDNLLVVGGLFNSAGGVAVKNIAAWNGTSWSAMGIGTAELFEFVSALAVYNNELIVGGYHLAVDGIINNIAAWDGVSWSALGSGVQGNGLYAVDALTVYNSRLIAGGSITSAGGAVVRSIAAWDGASWAPLGAGIVYVQTMYSTVKALSVYNNRLFAAGDFQKAGEAVTKNIAAWNDTTWSILNEGTVGDNSNFLPGVNALAVYDNKLIVGGDFAIIDGITVNNIAAWDGSSWLTLGSGLTGFEPYTGWAKVCALSVYNNQLIAGGNFTTAGGITANRIAAWDGSTWSGLGSGMSVANSLYGVSALTIYNNYLVAGGHFFAADGLAASHIAVWDGYSWSSLDSGLNGPVEALTIYDNNLVAGGNFTMAGDIPANHTAVWDGMEWTSLGTGIDGPVYAFAIFDDQLIAGGWFSVAGGVEANSIAAWNGTSWSPLGPGFTKMWDIATVSTLIGYGNNLIAGGSFEKAGFVYANNIAAWNGLAWFTLGSGTNGSVNVLGNYKGDLLTGGAFFTAGDKISVFLARWTKEYYYCGDINGDGLINIFDVIYLISYLYLSGPDPVVLGSADVNSDGNVDIFDINYLISYLYLDGPEPDCP